MQTLPEPLDKSALPTHGLMLRNDALEKLNQNVPPGDGKAFYVDGHITHDNQVLPISIRIRGSRHWNWNHPQKSWKVRVRGGGHLEGRTTFNFINSPEPMPFEEEIILDIAREQGLLAPEYHSVRLLLNRTYMGVYSFEAQPDERLLRAARRMPTSIYSGNGAPIDPATGVSSLWESSEHWKKVTAGAHGKPHEMAELDALLRAVSRKKMKSGACGSALCVS